MAHRITDISASEILDSRGNPTLKVTVFSGEHSGSFAVPAGASTGSHEALEKRDNDPKRFRGLGVQTAAQLVRTKILKKLKGKNIQDQKEIDFALRELDGSPNKSNLGANTILGVSVASAKAAAQSENLELYAYLKLLRRIKPSQKVPHLYLNLINAGKHASSYLAFQEYMIVPLAKSVSESLEIADRARSALRKKVVAVYGPFSANYGDEGGFVIQAKKVREPLELLTETIAELGLTGKIKLAIDAAASSFYENGKYQVDGQLIEKNELLEMYKDLGTSFDFLSIEDPFFEEDFDSFTKLQTAKKKIKIIGDDLTVTNPDRLKTAIAQKSITGIIIKPNQIGTLTETLDVMGLARKHNIDCIVSHRSGETSDDFIADLAYAFGAFGLKAGAPNRGERVAKYNRLWEISE
jgi:enolase